MALVSLPEIQTLDPYFGNVVLLLSGNGANGSTVFSDNSFFKRPVTPFGNAQISTAQSKFGSSSIYMDGAPASYVLADLTSVHRQFNMDWEIEGWVYRLSATWMAMAHIRSVLGMSPDNLGVHIHVQANGALTVDNGVTGTASSAAGVVPTSAWSFVRVKRSGGTTRGFVNEVQVLSHAAQDNNVVAQHVVLGRYFLNNGTVPVPTWNGYLCDFRVTKDVDRAVSVPTAEFPWIDASTLGARALDANLARRICAPGRALSPGGPVTAAFAEKLARRNIYQGGVGRITGTVKEKSLPTNVPLHRRVCLLEEKTRLLVAETWSDVTTGNYTFERIDMGRTYTVMSYDHTGLYRAVIADRIVPEMLP